MKTFDERLKIFEGFIDEAFSTGLVKPSLVRLSLPEKLTLIKQQIAKMKDIANTTGVPKYRETLLSRIKQLSGAEKKATAMLKKGIPAKKEFGWQTTY